MFRLLCVTAHPDDEAGGFGGTLLHYAARGAQTHVVCLTPGQAATHRPAGSSDEALAETRRKEMAAACKLLNVHSAEVLDHPDGALDRSNFYEMVGALVRRMRTIKPHVVMTFGGEGAVTAHRDHAMAGMAATLAFHWAAWSNRFPEQLDAGLELHRAQKLYYATTDFSIPDRQPASMSPVSARIDVRKYLDQKVAAFAAHTSQNPLLPIFKGMLEKRGDCEMFHLAAWDKFSEAQMETDLFAGVELD